MARHRQKDLDGGNLMTRKRLYKDQEGNVISKRPAKERRTTTAAVAQDPYRLPLSPPGSSPDLPIYPRHFEGDQPTAQVFPERPKQPEQQPKLADLQPFFDEFLPWNNPGFLSNDQGGLNGPFDDIFMPDTASSFNMPYTTANNYNWLFDLSFDEIPSEPTVPGSGRTAVSNDSICFPANYDSTGTITMFPAPDDSRDRMKAMSDSTGIAGNMTKQPLITTTEKPRRSPGRRQNPRSLETRKDHTAKTYRRESPMRFLTNNPSLPLLDDACYERLIDLIERANPMMPDGDPVNLHNDSTSQSSLQSFLDLYFTHFNTAYPLIHMASFTPSNIEPLLLLSMILLGATYADKESHQLAVCIHDVLRPQIFAHASFSARPELWILQTILLTECLGKSRGGQRQHDMSHLFHGLLINLIRRSECQSAAPENVVDTSIDTDQQWKTWIDLEQKKRLAQLCFVWDVQHAVLFSQSLCMSAFELRSTLPCDQALWEAPTADQWRDLWQSQTHKSSHLLTELKAYLNPSKDAGPPSQLNSLSRVVILHGLMSISWDMTRRDQTSLGMMGNSLSAGSWRDRMSTAYDAWKSDFDTFALGYSDSRTSNLEGDPRNSSVDFILANKAIYHAAQLILCAEIIDIQIFAGARHILGRPVSRADYSRSQTAVKTWARGDSARAAKATWHAAQILLDATSNDNNLIVVGNLFHHPWTICLAALTIWSFYHIILKVSEVEDDEMIWDPKADMKELVDTITSTPLHDLVQTSRRESCTAGMTAVVSNGLNVIRWGVVHDGMLVLKGLTPWRLIHEDRQ